MAGLMANSTRHAESGIEPARIVFRTAASARPITSTGTFERMWSNVSPTAPTNIAVVTSDLNADGPSPVVRTKICSSAEKGLPDDIARVAEISGDFGSGSATGDVVASAFCGSNSGSAMGALAADVFGASGLNSAIGGLAASILAASASDVAVATVAAPGFGASGSRSTSALEAVDSA